MCKNDTQNYIGLTISMFRRVKSNGNKSLIIIYGSSKRGGQYRVLQCNPK